MVVVEGGVLHQVKREGDWPGGYVRGEICSGELTHKPLV